MKVISSDGCDRVINTTKTINFYSSELRKKAFGIIDNDFREHDDIVALREDNIFVLPYNEIENMFLLEPCLALMKKHLFVDSAIDNIKFSIIKIIESKKKHILSDFASKTIRTIYKRNKLDDINHLEESLNSLNTKNNGIFLAKYSSFKNALDQNIILNNYDSLMKLVPGKMIIADIAAIYKMSDAKSYIKLLLSKLRFDEALKEKLRSFVDIPNIFKPKQLS
ncbi:MAG: DUF4435 domain-containing protein [Bacilli bacterium]|nr:DUF4435 domain-containing protein [Bacilli bacterium]